MFENPKDTIARLRNETHIDTRYDDLRESVECSKCGKVTFKIDLFSKGECLQCHEKNYKDDGIKPDFTTSIQI